MHWSGEMGYCGVCRRAGLFPQGLQEDKCCLGPYGELSLVHLCLGRVTLGRCSVDACVLTTPLLL